MQVKLKKGIPQKSYGRMSYRKLRERASQQLASLSMQLRDLVLKDGPMEEEDIDENLRTGKFRNSMFVHDGFTVMFTVENHGTSAYQHLSVSRKERYPSWDEIVLFRSLFFEDDDEIVQVIPKESDYVNVHDNCFHMWLDISGPHMTWLS